MFCQKQAKNNELQKILSIFNIIYKNQDFIIKDNTIIFEGDSYNDPVLTFLALNKHGVITASVISISHELDRIIIQKADIKQLNHLVDMGWPNYLNVQNKLQQMDMQKRELCL
jgi:hypothetical protein